MVKKLALVILEQANSKIALQLRDCKPSIAHPDHWALFGGKIEPGEKPKQAAIREIAEELTIHVYSPKVVFLKRFTLEQQKEHFLFYYPIQNELQNARLTEGQTFCCWSPDEIKPGIIGDNIVIPSHLAMLNWYWQHRMLQGGTSG